MLRKTHRRRRKINKKRRTRKNTMRGGSGEKEKVKDSESVPPPNDVDDTDKNDSSSDSETITQMVTDKAKILGAKILDKVIDNVADKLDITLTGEEKQELREVGEKMSIPVEKAGLDAVGILPGIGEVVEGMRFASDMAKSGEKLLESKDEIEKVVGQIEHPGMSLNLNDKVKGVLHDQHDTQKMIRDRTLKSKNNFMGKK